MKLLSNTIEEFIKSEVDRALKSPDNEGKEIRIVTSSLPAQGVLYVGEELNEYRHRLLESSHNIKIVYKVSYPLGESWENSDCCDEKKAWEKIKRYDWYDKDNHLTRFRNIKRDPGEEDVLLILLIGGDRVTDKSSLDDFYRLNSETIWQKSMNKSFIGWIEQRFQDSGIEYEAEHIEKINDLLLALKRASLADLSQISNYLEKLDLSKAQDGQDAYEIIVERLETFQLPSMRGLAASRRKKNENKYIQNAIDFFNYSQYIDSYKRNKAIKAITGYRDYIQKDETAEFYNKELGDYKDINDLLDSLEKYVRKNDLTEKQKLYSADFIFIQDKILKYKKPTQKRERKPKKLSGMPLEVVLRAIWLTLGDFKRKAEEMGLIANEEISKIQIDSVKFRHNLQYDSENGQGTASQREVDRFANSYLQRTIGGIDAYLEDQLNISTSYFEGNENLIEITSRLCPMFDESDLIYSYSANAESYLQFKVSVSTREFTLRREYRWRFPDTHPYRNMVDMFEWFCQDGLKHGNMIPVFSIPYYEEMNLAKDEEEVNRILQTSLQSEDKRIYNLLKARKIDHQEKTFKNLHNLASEYGKFISDAHKNGIFCALKGFPSLLDWFKKTYQTFLEDKYSQLAPILFKAFLMVKERPVSREEYWMWDSYEPSITITPLHPAQLEMIYHQCNFLCESFTVAVKQSLRESGSKTFHAKRWNDIVDLSSIEWPLYGTIVDESRRLATKEKSYELIHILGESKIGKAALTTRLLLKYEAAEEEEISDEELFRDTRESRLIRRVLKDYRILYPHANDGISIAAYCGGNIQTLIAGVDSFLKQTLKDRSDERIYTLSLTLFSESQDDSTISRWVNEWKTRWGSGDYSKKYSYYSKCRISVANRIIERDENFRQFTKLLRDIELDVVFLINFIQAGSSGNRFQEISSYIPEKNCRLRMFPILEKACCAVRGGAHEFVRERIISNNQFKIGPLHTQVMARINGKSPSDNRYVVMGQGDFSPWIKVVDKFHQKSAWVVCIDPSIDERLVSKEDIYGVRKRKIIGFGSGVGAHGEQNYTVSTEYFSFADVKKKISSHISNILGPLDQENSEKISDCLLKESSHMAGMSLVRATGPTEYVRDYIAYAMVRKLLPREPNSLCDELISLDAYKHWFDSAANEKRPDLIHLKANIKDGIFHIDAQLIECKLAEHSERYIEKAREQIENGLNHLICCFRPRKKGEKVGLNDRPDQRYWWLQLHRLIASKGQVSKQQLEETIGALERMSDGLFSIEWKASVVTFWTDSNSDKIETEDKWKFLFEDDSIPINIINTGPKFIRKACMEEGNETLPVSDDGLLFSSVGVSKETLTNKGGEEEKGRLSALKETEVSNDISAPKDTIPSIDVKSLVPKPEPLVLKTKIPDRIYIGRSVNVGRVVYWEYGHKDLANRHILIFGTSGMGKTYTIQVLLCELARYGQNSLIIDYTNGFLEERLEPLTRDYLKPKQYLIRTKPIPINPFRIQKDVISGVTIPEKPANTAQRVSGVFSEVYQFGDQQKSAIYNSIKNGLKKYGKEMSFTNLIKELQILSQQGGQIASSANSVISKIQPFVDMDPFGPEDRKSWEKLFNDNESRCHIFQLAGFLKDAGRLITEFSLIDLYWYYRILGQKDIPRIIVLDEIQNLDHRLDSPLGKFLTEGRKFGISLILATQTLSNLGKDERDRLFQACHKLFFKPADTEIRDYANIISNATNERVDVWIKRLAKLSKGECYSLGPSLNKHKGYLETRAFRIKVDSLESRFK